MKRLLICIFLISISFEVYSQKSIWDEFLVKESLERIQRLEETMSDSLQYAKELYRMAEYCQDICMCQQSKEMLELSIRILESKLKTTTEDDRYPILRELVFAHTFLGNLSIGKKNLIFPGGMMEQLAVTNYQMEIYVKALEMIQKGIESKDSVLIQKANYMLYDLPDNWDEQSCYYWERGDLKSAMEVLADALEKQKQEGGEDLQKILERLDILLLLNDFTMNSADQCIKLADKMYYPAGVLDILYKQRLPEYLMILRTTGLACEKAGRLKKAKEAYTKILNYLPQIIGEDLFYLYPSERSALWEIVKPYFDIIQGFVSRNTRMSGMAEFLYNSNLLKKELFTTVSYKQKEAFAVVRDNYITTIEQEMDKLRLAKETFRHLSEKEYIYKLKNEILIRSMERILTVYQQEQYPVKHTWHREWKEIAASLSPQEAVVEIVSLLHMPNDFLNTEYLAVVFTSKDTAPHLISLGGHFELIATFVNDDKCYKRIWKPIEKLISGCTHIYLSTDGFFNSMPIARIFDGKQFLCEKYILHHVLYAGDIPSIKQQQEGRNRDIVFFGGAEFNLPSDAVYSTERGQGFAYLPGTIAEIDSISRKLPNDWMIHKYIGKEANEGNFRQLSYKPMSSGVLHIATHGFNLKYNDSIQSSAIVYHGESGNKDPLLRTGFLLSGANEAWRNENSVGGQLDGIVTASEVSVLNLSSFDLVVISACYSGEGELRDGEGIFGLPRAFRLAGVKAMIVSLWAMSDKVAAEFMTTFYQHWQKEMSKSEAFTRAQRDMIRKYPDRVKEWAGFLLIE